MNDLSFHYLFFYESNEKQPLAVAYFQQVHFTTKHYQFPLFSNFFIKSFEKLLMRKGFQILVCGNLFRVDFPGIYLRHSQISITDIFTGMEQFFRQSSTKADAILMKDWQIKYGEDEIKEFGYQPWPGDLTMKLDLRSEWFTFSDYSSALKHKYAQRLRKIRGRCKDVIRKELSLEDINKYGKELERLYIDVVYKQAIRLVIANSSYLVEMKKTYDSAFRIIGYFDEGKLIAFSSHLIYDDLWELHYIGMDYQKNESLLLYFNMMYDGIEMAILSRKTAVELGRTAREAKAMLGGKPVYFNSYYRLTSVLVRELVKRFAGTFDDRAGTSWQLRHPYKI